MGMQRLYVDSRDRSSGTNEDFIYALPRAMQVPQESVAVLDTVFIPHSYYSVTAGVDDRVYLQESNFSAQRLRVVTLQPGFYNPWTFAVELAERLNEGRLPGGPVMPYTVKYNQVPARLSISNDFKGMDEWTAVWSTEALKHLTPGYFGPDFDPSDPRDAGRQLGMREGTSAHSVPNHGPQTLTMNRMPKMEPHLQLFIHGDLGLPGTCVGPRGATDVLRRISVTVPPSAMISDTHGTHFDNIRVAPGTLTTLSFRLLGWDGRPVDLNGQPWSFSLVIFPE